MIAWRGAASAGLVSSADRAYMNAPVPRVEMARQPFEEFPVRLQILDNGIADRFFPANLEHTAGLGILPQHALYHLRISHPGILERPGFLHQIQLTGVGATIG